MKLFKRKVNKLYHTKAIIQLDEKSRIVKRYKSLNEAERKTGYLRSPLSVCWNGKRNMAYGWRWIFDER